MVTYCSLMTGHGFSLEVFGSFSLAWIAMVLLFFIVIFGRRYLGEEFGLPYSMTGAFVGAYAPYIVSVTLSCSPKWSLLIGLIGWIIGAFLIGTFLGEEGGSDYG